MQNYREMARKKVWFLPLTEKENLLFCGKSNVLKISAISFVLRTREITDIFNTFDKIYLVFTSKK